MSYDVYFEKIVSVGESLNYTYNCGAMFARALGGDGLYSLDKMLGADALLLLDRAVKHMADPKNRELYEAMNPSNGWGSHKTATEFLTKMRDTCRDFPECTVRIT